MFSDRYVKLMSHSSQFYACATKFIPFDIFVAIIFFSLVCSAGRNILQLEVLHSMSVSSFILSIEVAFVNV